MVRLPEAEPETFHTYVHWLYASTLEMAFIPEPHTTQRAPSYRNPAKIWISANFLGDDELCNIAADHTIIKMTEDSVWVSGETLTYICEHTSAGSAIRRLHCDIAMARYTAQDLENNGPGILP